MIYVISDLHGTAPEKLERLLDRAGFGLNDELYILGDVVDRNGDGGAAMLSWLLVQPNVWLLLGNHEAMLLACEFAFDEITDESLGVFTEEKLEHLLLYYSNGGGVTLDHLKLLPKEDREEIFDYLREAPLYLTVRAGSRNYLLVHSGFANFRKDRPLSSYAAEELLWARPAIDERFFDQTVTVFGHTPTAKYGEEYRGRILYTDTWIDIDVGVGWGEEPVLLRLDDLKEFTLDS
ncbi:MAG: metallophosphoesterase [Lachnospiraceae bacterium]|nr:metallophosphoesterase [Lachnospiraceae bacterium]